MSEGAVLLFFILVVFVGYSYFGSKNNTAPSEPSRESNRDMVQVVQSMFPSISERSIAYDLSKTGSVQATTEKLLASNSLPEPPSTFVYHSSPSRQPPARTTSAQKNPAYTDLITRFNLNDKIKMGITPERVNFQWGPSKAEREAMFKRKREEFILQGLRNQLAFEKNTAAS